MEGRPGLRNSVSVSVGLQHHLEIDCVTMTKAAATAESSVTTIKLYPEEYSCKMQRTSYVLLNEYVMQT